MRYVIALDAGTTSVRAFVYDTRGHAFVHRAQQEVALSLPRPGWVEQDADEIYFKAMYVLNDCIRFAGAENVAGIGIANQREAVVMWDRRTGEPVCPVIGWQCRRTGAWCAALDGETKALIRAHTGLVPDAYFSASKIVWNFENIPAVRTLAAVGQLCAGTVDSYLIFKFTEGRSFVTDVTNASRTMLFDLHNGVWDEGLLRRFGIPRAILPEVRASDARMGEMRLGGRTVPIAGTAGDQQAALFGQACLGAGEGKITYGTGLFFLMHTGGHAASSVSGLLTTAACGVNGKRAYALEGSCFHAGSGVKWLRDRLGLISSAEESGSLAESIPDTGGVSFVPAFTGLGAPYWAPDARGMFTGITQQTGRAELVRAVLESIAFGARDLADCMRRDGGMALSSVRCDGGASANDFLMQFQADVLGVEVDRPAERESTALGAAFLAMLALGIAEEDALPALRRSGRRFVPNARLRAAREASYLAYRKAVERALR